MSQIAYMLESDNSTAYLFRKFNEDQFLVHDKS